MRYVAPLHKFHALSFIQTVTKTGLPVAPKQLAVNQAKAKKTFHIVRAEFSKQTTSKQASGAWPEVEQVEDPSQSKSYHLELGSTPDTAASFTARDKEDTYGHSLVKDYSNFTINDKPVTLNHQISPWYDSGGKSNATQLYHNVSIEAVRTTPLFSGMLLDRLELGIFNQYGLYVQL